LGSVFQTAIQFAYVLLQGWDGLVDASPDALVGELGEPPLHQVEPGGPVGVKCRWKRGWASSHLLMSGVLWVA
jgi:hypothetical protein